MRLLLFREHMTGKFYFFDMDGTLVSPIMKKLLPSSIEGIRRLQRQGDRVFICTGRSYQMAMEYSDQLQIPGVIFCNGAGIAWEGRLLESHPMDREKQKELISFCKRTCSGYQLLGFEHTYQNRIGRLLMHIAFPKKGSFLSEEQKKRRATMVPLSRYRGEEILKMDIFNLNRHLAERFYREVPDGLQYFCTYGRYMFNAEIMMSGNTKAKGIQRVLQMFDGKVEDAWCFGDSVNDIEMMKICGHSVAMGNASKEVKEAADYVTDDANHDGIFNALNHFGLLER